MLACVSGFGIFRRHKRAEAVVVKSTVGLTSVLPCQPSTNNSVIWSYIPANGKSSPIVDNDDVVNGYKTRFSLDSSGNARRDLVIRNTLKSDDGLYRCTEKGGIGQDHDVRLIVEGIGLHINMQSEIAV
jgi:hypothetical protein